VNYRAKLTLAMVLLAVFTGSLVTGVFFLGSRKLLFQEIRSHAISIASTGAIGVNGDDHESIRSVEDPAYAPLCLELRRIRDANRRSDVEIRFVYSMRPRGDGTWEFVGDAEEDASEKSLPGDLVEFEGGGAPLALGEAYAENSFSKDEYGVWLSANAPIKTQSGRIVAMLGVDIAASEILGKMNALLGVGVLAIGVATLCAILLGVVLAGRATRPLTLIRQAIRKISEGDWEARANITAKDEFGEVASAVNQMAVSLREREMLKGALARYVSYEIAEQVLAQNGTAQLRGKRSEISVCIVDIRNFTALSSKLPPEDIVEFLNRFFERMIDVVFSHRGTLDKFLGDGFIAIFGAPLEDPNHREMAVRAALSMLEAKEALREELLQKHGIELRIGIAVNTGPAVVGNVGSEQRMEFTAIGDAVNVASRIEALNKEYQTECLVSGSTADGVSSEIPLRSIGEVQLRGVSDPVRLFTTV
jgi:adenylate cyclase